MRDYALNQAVFRGEIGSPMLARLWRNWLARRAVARLEDLDDHILRDIGVTRAEIRWARGLPLSANSALALEERSQKLRFHPERTYL
jgi:uncharacterized protein YjiS (DUF1127 family)